MTDLDEVVTPDVAWWRQLQAERLVDPQAEVPATTVFDVQPESWAIRLVAGVGGLWAGGFLVGFLITLFSLAFDNAGARVLLSAACFAAAITAYRKTEWRKGVFLQQFALSFSLAGQVLALGASASARLETVTSALVLGLLQIVLLALVRNALHRILCTLLLASCIGVLAGKAGHPVFAAPVFAAALAVLWQRTLACHVAFDPLHAGATVAMAILAIGLAYGDVLLFTSARTTLSTSVVHGVAALSAAGLWIFICYCLGVWRLEAMTHAVLAIGVPLIVGMVLPSLLLTLAAVVMALALRRRALAVMAVIALVAVVALYYYGRQTTLMVKSIEMFVIGALLLATWGGLRLHKGAAR